jgi:hypothetical protein
MALALALAMAVAMAEISWLFTLSLDIVVVMHALENGPNIIRQRMGTLLDKELPALRLKPSSLAPG